MQHVIVAVSFCYVKSIFFPSVFPFYQIVSEKEYFRRENLKE